MTNPLLTSALVIGDTRIYIKYNPATNSMLFHDPVVGRDVSLVELISGGGPKPFAYDSSIDISPLGYNYTFKVNDYISKTEVTNISGGLLKKSGDTMTGVLTLNSNVKLNNATENQTSSGTIIQLPAVSGSNFVFGDIGRVNNASTVSFGNASSLSTADGTLMCVDAAISASQLGNWLFSGIASRSTWSWNVGGKIYLSTNGTSGNTMTQIAPSGSVFVMHSLGYALTPTRIVFSPTRVLVINGVVVG